MKRGAEQRIAACRQVFMSETGPDSAPLRVVDVAFARAVRREFSYRVPDDWPGEPRPGMRVVAPLAGKEERGIIVSVGSPADPGVRLKTLSCPVDPGLCLPQDVLDLARWISGYYFCSWGEALAAASGPAIAESEEVFKLRRPALEVDGMGAPKVTPREKIVLRSLSVTSRTTLRRLRERVGETTDLPRLLKRLRRKDLIESEWRTRLPPIPERALFFGLREPEAAEIPAALRALFPSRGESGRGLPLIEIKKCCPGGAAELGRLLSAGLLNWDPTGRSGVDDLRASPRPEPGIDELDPEQKTATDAIAGFLRARKYETALLWGPTGSGKTAVYCAAIREAWALGRQALYLVPEIALATQLIRRLEVTLGEPVAVWHSKLTRAERGWMLRLIAAGRYRLVVGARSAVFSPLPDPGLIIVDEEHAETYKQSEPAPRYHARDAAVMRARLNAAVCILGSATPSAESYENAQSGKYKLLRLTHRVAGRAMPAVRLVDLRGRKGPAEERWLTPELREALETTLGSGRKAIVFINRRGHSTLVSCRDCGHAERCPHCDLTLTYHSHGKVYRCHLCTHSLPARDTCAACGSTAFLYRGVGTQKIEEVLAKLDAPVRLARLDSDVAGHRGAAEAILNGFAGEEYNLLIGTQMVTKGLDVADVGLVGVIWADQQMAFPDFRAEEKTFQLLTQVAGRAGRGTGKNAFGLVLVQTFHPEHELIELAAAQDTESFFERELPRRRELHYPPFSRLILVSFTAADSAQARVAADRLATAWQALPPADKRTVGRLLGPAPAAVPRRATAFRYQILFKTKSVSRANLLIERYLNDNAAPLRRQKIDVIVNVDPMDFL